MKNKLARINAASKMRAQHKAIERAEMGIKTARDAETEKNLVVDIELNSAQIGRGSTAWFAWVDKHRGAGQVTSGYHNTREEAETEAMQMAVACWGNVNVVEDD